MIELGIEKAAKAVAALGWIERMGGLARPISLAQEQGDAMGQVTYPVATKMSAQDCANRTQLNQLVPDGRKKSLVYFEQLGSMQVLSRTRKHTQITGRARLVHWANMQLLGIPKSEHATTPSKMDASLIYALSAGTVKQADETDSNIYTVEYNDLEVVQKDARIFGAYSYKELQVEAMLLYPYTFGAIDFKISLTVSDACFNELVTAEPLTCIW